LAPNARFCGSCGQRLDAAPPGSVRSTPAAAVALDPLPAGGGESARAASQIQALAPAFIARVKNIVLAPRSEWDVIAPESTTVAQLYTGYVVILSALAALFSFVRLSLIGVSLPFGGGVLRYPLASGLTTAAMGFVFGLVGVLLVGLIINALAGTFSARRDQRQALKVAAYSLTPAWLGSVLALSPVLPSLLQFVSGCYGIYVLYLGLPVVMGTPRDKAVGYTAAVVIGTILTGILFGAVAGGLGLFGPHAGVFGSSSPFGAQTAAQEQAAQRDQGAAVAGNIIGNMLGTDAQGKAGLGAAISNLAKVGEQSQQAAQASGGARGGAGAPPTAADVQNAVAGSGGLLNAVGGALGGPRRATPVDYRTLSDLLPASLEGMKRTSAEGSAQGAIGVKTTSAVASYAGADGAAAHLEIADLTGVSGLMDLANNLVQTKESQSDSGYERDVTLNGRNAHEIYDARARKGEISMQIAKRFTVELTGQGLDMRVLEQAYGEIDLARLEGLKDQGAQQP
jgi:hypothetical protein